MRVDCFAEVALGAGCQLVNWLASPALGPPAAGHVVREQTLGKMVQDCSHSVCMSVSVFMCKPSPYYLSAGECEVVCVRVCVHVCACVSAYYYYLSVCAM